ncbi:MAG TPA: hypothetical protein VFE47_32080 [Tepidisphaeraceae bacterium]|nr:hypothetical protein [Tepidisphaeraceae bacterium]
MLSDVQYHPYVLMIACFDEEWSRRASKDPRAELREVCFTFKENLNRNYKRFLAAQGQESDSKSKLDNYLFDPICYIPFGHADVMALTLMDDFDPLQHVTANVNSTVEDLALAFCPTLDSLQLGEDSKPFFCDLHTMVSREGIDDSKPPTSWHWEHEFQRNTPLLAFTRYKMDSMGSLGSSLLFQQTILKALAKKTGIVCRALKSPASGDPSKSLMCDEDVGSLRIVVLDLQGAEELGTLIFCKNYSAAMCVVSAIRSMTYGDVFEADARFKHVIDNSWTQREVLRLSIPGFDPNHDKVSDRISDNHVFRWTNTTLSVSHSAFADPTSTPCNGLVEALAFIQLAPGHHDRTLKMATTAEIAAGITPDPAQNVQGVKSTEETSHHRYHVGIADVVVPYAMDESACHFPQVTLAAAIDLIRKNLVRFSDAANRMHGRDVIDIATSLTIPLPRMPQEKGGDLLAGNVGNAHCSPLLNLLPEVQKRLCFPSLLKGKNRPTDLGKKAGRLNLAILKRIPRKCGIPLHLRRTIEYLYQNFATIIADPLMFDAILDLYDTFATLHAILTSHLPRVRAKEVGRDRNSVLPPMDASRVHQLSLMVDAIHNALAHRISKAYPETQLRDMAIDFRGGLNQVLLAAEAPLICGLGLLRKYVHRFGAPAPSRDALGGLTKISFAPGARACQLRLGVERMASLVFVEADVPHVLHAPSYADYLHECAHFLLGALKLQGIDTFESHKIGQAIRAAFRGDLRLPDPAHEAYVRERIEEVFAGLITHIFLFGRDTEAFLFHHVIIFAKSLSGSAGSDSEIIAQFSELIIRLFVVVDSIPTHLPRIRWIERPWKKRRGAGKRFESVLDSLGPLLPNYDRLWKDRNGPCRVYCRTQFKKVYSQLVPYLPDLWEHAMGIFEQFFEHALRMPDDPNGDLGHEIESMVEQALSSGKPLLRILRKVADDGGQTPDLDACTLDLLTLTCAILYGYISKVKTARGKEIYLSRPDPDGSPDYLPPPNDRKWYEFQIDIGAAALFSPVPKARAERLRKEITLLKTFWDISSALRARRLREILEDNWTIH